MAAEFDLPLQDVNNTVISETSVKTRRPLGSLAAMSQAAMNLANVGNEPPAFRFLTALPVYNEEHHVDEVLDKVRAYATDILVVNDGSSDGTGKKLAARNDIAVVTHKTNQGYGAALKTAFEYAIVHRYDVLVTIDCDGQHEPQRIQALVNACDPTVDNPADIVSGSRYLDPAAKTKTAPRDRRRINLQITEEMNCRFGLNLTDSFCGFKAYRVQALAKLNLKETGYAMPLELWVQAAAHQMQIVERSVPLIYLDEERTFGGALDESDTRLRYYHEVMDRAMEAARPLFAARQDQSATDDDCRPCPDEESSVVSGS